jgi:hypothetical protein
VLHADLAGVEDRVALPLRRAVAHEPVLASSLQPGGNPPSELDDVAGSTSSGISRGVVSPVCGAAEGSEVLTSPMKMDSVGNPRPPPPHPSL